MGPQWTSQGTKSVPRWWCARDRPQCTHVYTQLIYTRTHKREITNILNNGAQWAIFLGIFSRVPAHSWPFDTERRRRFAPTSVPHYNAVRAHRTGSNNSGAEYCLSHSWKSNKKTEDNTHNNWNKSNTSDKNERWDQRPYVLRYISYANESQQKLKLRRQHSTHKKKTGWIDVQIQGNQRKKFIIRRTRFFKKNVRSGIRTSVLDDAKCDGATCWATGVRYRTITQPRVAIEHFRDLGFSLSHSLWPPNLYLGWRIRKASGDTADVYG